MSVFFITGIFMSFFIVLLLLTKKEKTLPDKILAVWMAVIGIHLLWYYFKQAGLWDKYPDLIGVTAPIPLFHGPLLYLYCRYSLKNVRKIRPVEFLHFLPGIAAYLYMFNFFFFYSAREKIMVDKGELNDFSTFSTILLIAILISGLGYAVLSYRLTIRHKRKLEDRYSYSEGINLQWLRYCILSIGLVFIVAVLVFILRDALNYAFPFNPEYIFYAIMIILIFYIGYFGIKHEHIFVNNTLPENEIAGNQAAPKKYEKSGMKAEEAAQWLEKLLHFMENEKPYLNPRLSLSELAGQMDISMNQLSQIINQHAGVNFHDFINRYRVEAFLRKAEKNKNFSLLALALDAGFNSKSTFNAIFKKHKGLSPSQYLAKKEQERIRK